MILLPKGKNWRILLAVALLLLFGISTVGSRFASGMITPFTRITRTLNDFVALMWENIFHPRRFEELKEAEIRFQELNARVAEVDKVMEENRQLRAMLNLPEVQDWRALRGEVIMRDPLQWNWNFRIGLGEADGVLEGAPVLFGPFLAGRVSQVFNRSANVDTLANPSCAVSVYVFSGDNVYVGVLRGSGQPSGSNISAEVDFLPKHAAIHEGAIVTTSGLGTELPGGLPIGVVLGKARLIGDARMCTSVALNADLRWIKFVSVMMRSPADSVEKQQ